MKLETYESYETSNSAQGNLTKLFYKTNGYEKYSFIIITVESWNKIRKQLKFPRKLKQLLVIFILNHNNSSIIMTLLVHKHLQELFQLLVTSVIFLFTALVI